MLSEPVPPWSATVARRPGDVRTARSRADLAASPAGPAVATDTPGSAARGPANLLRFVLFEVLLVLAAYVVAVDLESDLRSWSSIALEVWVVGNLAAAVGVVLLGVVAVLTQVTRR